MYDDVERMREFSSHEYDNPLHIVAMAMVVMGGTKYHGHTYYYQQLIGCCVARGASFRSKVKSQYANELELTATGFRALSGPTEDSNYLKQPVGRMLLQRLATGATGVKQARYT